MTIRFTPNPDAGHRPNEAFSFVRPVPQPDQSESEAGS